MIVFYAITDCHFQCRLCSTQKAIPIRWGWPKWVHRCRLLRGSIWISRWWRESAPLWTTPVLWSPTEHIWRWRLLPAKAVSSILLWRILSAGEEAPLARFMWYRFRRTRASLPGRHEAYPCTLSEVGFRRRPGLQLWRATGSRSGRGRRLKRLPISHFSHLHFDLPPGDPH